MWQLCLSCLLMWLLQLLWLLLLLQWLLLWLMLSLMMCLPLLLYAATYTDVAVGEILAVFAQKPAGVAGAAGNAVAGHAVVDVVPRLAGLWLGGWAAASVVEAL